MGIDYDYISLSYLSKNMDDLYLHPAMNIMEQALKFKYPFIDPNQSNFILHYILYAYSSRRRSS